MPRHVLAATLALLAASSARGQDVAVFLRQKVLTPGQTLAETQRFIEPRVPQVPKIDSAKEWEAYAARLRQDVLDRVVYRGEAAKWRDAKLGVQWQDTLPGGPGYRLKRLCFEAVPGLWVPALLYEPEKLEGRVPAALCVMGHDPGGKEVAYQQIRCINLAKRGMLALNVEWFGFGQLAGANYSHARMNQLDLCGTSGLAPFYLALKRGLDVLLSHEHADPKRVAVSGLSGGGWQTIFLSALDGRVTLSNPVAGYSSFRTRLRHFKDLGDSEQTPCDLATVADYDHLTALLAPRPALLTYNAKDECCFESGYALPPLLDAAGPVYRLFGKKELLRSHVNHQPGTHNYEKDNREAFYRIVGDAFFPGDKGYKADEIPSDGEVKPRLMLAVKLPAKNEDFHSLAAALGRDLPRRAEPPEGKADAWRAGRRKALRELVKAHDYDVKAVKVAEKEADGLRVTHWRLELGRDWSVPAVELSRGGEERTAVLVHDDGRGAAAKDVQELLKQGQRVVVVDPFFIGESRVGTRDYLFALLVSAVGERPLGVQASQLTAVARWAGAKGGVALHGRGPRSGLAALVAAALEPAVREAELRGSFASLREVIGKNRTVAEMPEVFCFGLLAEFDVPQLAALAAPRRVSFSGP